MLFQFTPVLGYRKHKVRKNGLSKIPAEWRLFIKRFHINWVSKKYTCIFIRRHLYSLNGWFLKPIILIPMASLNHLSTDQMEAVLLHELAHIKRYDYLLNMTLSVVEMALFFNPFTQLLSKNIHRKRTVAMTGCYNLNTMQLPTEALLQIAYLQSVPALPWPHQAKK